MAPQHSALAAAAAAALAAVLFLRRHRAATPPPLPVPSTMMAVIARDGKLVVEKAWPTPVPSAGEVLIRVRTTSINRLDTVQRKGFAKPPPGATEVLGLECAGEVAASGAGVSFRPGDRVMALLPGGGYAEYVSVSALTVMRMPAHLSWAEAGSIAEAWLTAYQLVVLTAGVQPGDVVLIHAACSGVGLAAIQIVTGVLGATAVVTVGSRQKLELCVAHGAVGGAAHTEGEWAAKVTGLSPTGSFSVVLDPVAGAYADQNLQVLGMDGRWVLYSSLSGPAMGEDLSKTFLKALMLKRVSLLATTLRARPLAYKAELVRRFSTEVLPRLGRPGGLRLIIDREVEGLDAAQGAHEYMESNANMGKIVLHVSAGGQR